MNERPFRLIVGLGNPGREYQGSRHNAGFMVLDQLCASFELPWKKAPRAEALAGRMEDGTMLLKPMSFMNLSGNPVSSVCRYYQFEPGQILVIYDDISLPLGDLRLRDSGSHGGHNGMRSIIEQTGTNEIPRIRVGIGSARGGELTSHVLGRFSEQERPVIEESLRLAADAVRLAQTRGFEAAKNQYNRKTTTT